MAGGRKELVMVLDSDARSAVSMGDRGGISRVARAGQSLI